MKKLLTVALVSLILITSGTNANASAGYAPTYPGDRIEIPLVCLKVTQNIFTCKELHTVAEIAT